MLRNLLVIHGHNKSGSAPSLSVDPTLFSGVTYEGTTVQVAVDVASESQEWDYSDDALWILVRNATKIGDDTSVDIQISANSSGSPRTGHVTFTSADCADVVVTINQVANPI